MFISELNSIGKGDLSLPNSVCLLDSKKIIVADGGNNCIKILDYNTGKVIRKVGTFGLGRYKFKEPVGAFMSPTNDVFIMDWHNHRVVILNEFLYYKDEFGFYVKKPKINGFSLLDYYNLMKSFTSSGSYIKSHYSEDLHTEKRGSKNIFSQIFYLAQGLFYFYSRKRPFNVFSNNIPLNKPNGAAFIDGILYLTVKNYKSLLKIDFDNKRVIHKCSGPTDTIAFGRLGNVNASPSGCEIYVCDPDNQAIWILGKDLEFIDQISGKHIGESFYPFSLCFLSEIIIAVTDQKRFLIVDIVKKKVLYASCHFGEPHGISFCKYTDTLFVADRLHGIIRKYWVFE